MEPANLKQLAQNALKSAGEYLASDIEGVHSLNFFKF